MTSQPPILRVVRMENPYAIAEMEVIRQLSMWTMDQSKWLAVAEGIKGGYLALFCASTVPDRLEGVFIIGLPMDALQDIPQVVHFQCQGGLKLRKKMVETLVAFVKQCGYTSFAAMNGSRVPDAVWLRTFRDGGPIVRQQTIFEFDAKERAQRERSSKKPVRRKQERTAVVKLRDRRNPGRAKGVADPIRRKLDQRSRRPG